MLPAPNAALHHALMFPARLRAALATLALLFALPAAAAAAGCLPDGSGRLDMVVSGALEARIAWAEGMECQGMPRPDGSGLRVMFANRQELLLVVIGISGVERGATGEDLPANFTLVKEGAGEFYSTLGDELCSVTLLENAPLEGTADEVFRIRGEGVCQAPVPAVGREGEVAIRPFAFTGMAIWPAPAGER